MTSGSPSFLKYAGAMPTYDMFKAQRLAIHQDIPTEKQADSPDRPDNILRSMRTGDMSGILQTAQTASPDAPDAVLERGKQAAATGTDSPDAVLERGRQAAAAGADTPEAILARGRQAAPEQNAGRVISERA